MNVLSVTRPLHLLLEISKATTQSERECVFVRELEKECVCVREKTKRARESVCVRKRECV